MFLEFFFVLQLPVNSIKQTFLIINILDIGIVQVSIPNNPTLSVVLMFIDEIDKMYLLGMQTVKH